MGARHKINRAVLNGCVLIAGVIGFLSGSWLAFGIVLAVELALAIYAGDIRVRPNKRR